MNSLKSNLAFCFLLVFAMDARASLIGVQYRPGNVYSINETTGATTLIGSTGFSNLNSLAKDNSGTLYSIASSFTIASSIVLTTLLTINQTTGAGTAETAISGIASGHTIRAMSFSPGNQLFAVASTAPGIVDKFYSINTSTGVASFIGLMGFSDVQGLDFDASGTLYASGVHTGLLTVNTATGAATDVNLAIGGGDLQSIVFAADGTLYGIGNDLSSINKSTGAFTFISSNLVDLRGVEDLGPDVIPEPTTSALALAALCLAMSRVRKESPLL